MNDLIEKYILTNKDEKLEERSISSIIGKSIGSTARISKEKLHKMVAARRKKKSDALQAYAKKHFSKAQERKRLREI